MVDYGFRSRRRRTRIKSRHALRINSNIFLYSRLSRYALIGLIGGIILMVLLFFWYSRDLPEPGKLIEARLQIPPGFMTEMTSHFIRFMKT